jgi:peptide/nickel transport system permease protein
MSEKLRRGVSAVIHDRQLFAGALGILLLVLIIILAPAITKYPGEFMGPDNLAPPGSPGHPLGTNHMGQDVWSMLVYGTKTSLWVAIVAAFIAGFIGLFLGGIAGYFGNKTDAIISEVINVFMMIPDLFLIMLVVALFGNSLTNVMIVIGITTWPRNAKLMRAQTLSLKERTYIASARAMGENSRQILFKYIIPNGMYPVVSNTTMGMAYAVLIEAALSFIGLGDPNVVSWGQMINDGKDYIFTAPWVSVFAGVAVVITVLIFNLTGDGLNHVLNPQKLQRAGR